MSKKVNPMAYYIYENWQAGPHKTVIHNGTCGHCKDGKGKAEGYDPNHAQWHGPFPTLENARDVSQRMSNILVHKECRCVKR